MMAPREMQTELVSAPESGDAVAGMFSSYTNAVTNVCATGILPAETSVFLRAHWPRNFSPAPTGIEVYAAPQLSTNVWQGIYSHYSWHKQEMFKGRAWFEEWLGTTHWSGWGFNVDSYTALGVLVPITSKHYTPEQAAGLTFAQIRSVPVFNPYEGFGYFMPAVHGGIDCTKHYMLNAAVPTRFTWTTATVKGMIYYTGNEEQRDR